MTDRVRELAQGRDIDEMRVFHAYGHIEEAYDEIQSQQLEIGVLEQSLEDLEHRVIVLCGDDQLPLLSYYTVGYVGGSVFWDLVVALARKARSYIFGFEEWKSCRQIIV